jgi:hypothetical protein
MAVKKNTTPASLVMSREEFEPLKERFVAQFRAATTDARDLASRQQEMARDILTICAAGYFKGSSPDAKKQIPAGRDWLAQSKETGELITELWTAAIDPAELMTWSAITLREPSRHPVRQSVDRYVRLLRFDAMKAAGDNPARWGVTDPRQEKPKGKGKAAPAVATPAARLQAILTEIMAVDLTRFTAIEAVAMSETLTAITLRVESLRATIRAAATPAAK